MTYTFNNGKLCITENKKENEICNFLPCVVDVKSYEIDNMTSYDLTLYLKYSEKEYSNKFQIKLEDLRFFNWESFDIKCNLFVLRAKVSYTIYKIVREEIQKIAPLPLPYFDKLGWITYKGQPAYVAGNKVITPSGALSPDKFAVSSELGKLNLEFNNSIDEDVAFNYFYRLLKLNKNSLSLGLTLITSILYSVYEEAGHTPNFTVYCLGKSQTKKTTLARLICSIYNRNASEGAGITDLLSSSAAMKKETQKYRDCCFILDDLHPSECKADMHHREERLSERIRIAGNNSERKTQQANSLSTKCIYITTAEYMLKSYSTNARCVILHFDELIDNYDLRQFQQDKTTLPTFVFYFLLWAVGNKSKISNYIKNNILHNNYIEPIPSPRLEESQQFLFTSLHIFLDYMDKVMSLTKKNRTSLIINFRKKIHMILMRQNSKMEQLLKANDPEAMFQVIVKAYQKFKIPISKPKDIKNCVSAIHKGCVYLDPDYALYLVQKSLNNPNLTKIALNKALRSIGVLSTDHSGKMTKKLNGKRMLVFQLEDITPDIYTY
jgi:hypothetical protein